jgi:hypothetical protein
MSSGKPKKDKLKIKTDKTAKIIEKKLEKQLNNDHYVDNKEFLAEMIKWKKEIREAEDTDDERPPISNYIGECFLKIAERLCSKSNFANYPYKDEMIGDGIENCLMYAHNFNPRKSKNPFSYFTQIIYYAFLRRIEKEKKQGYVKFKLTEELNDGTLHKWFKENYFDKTNEREALSEHFNISERDIEKYEPKKRKKRSKNKS